MKHQYDWSKLDAGWTYHDYPWPQLYSLRRNMYLPLAEVLALTDSSNSSEPHPGYFEALAQLAKCRVEPAPAPAPAPKPKYEWPTDYNWNKLEGTGWRVGNGAYITNGKFNYWYTTWPKLEALFKFDANEALADENAAFEAVEKCRIDWKEEVTEACRGTGMSPVLGARGTIFTIGNALNVDDQRRMRVLSTSMLDCTKLLALSLVIERLKKLGWRES